MDKGNSALVGDGEATTWQNQRVALWGVWWYSYLLQLLQPSIILFIQNTYNYLIAKIRTLFLDIKVIKVTKNQIENAKTNLPSG